MNVKMWVESQRKFREILYFPKHRVVLTRNSESIQYWDIQRDPSENIRNSPIKSQEIPHQEIGIYYWDEDSFLVLSKDSFYQYVINSFEDIKRRVNFLTCDDVELDSLRDILKFVKLNPEGPKIVDHFFLAFFRDGSVFLFNRICDVGKEKTEFQCKINNYMDQCDIIQPSPEPVRLKTREMDILVVVKRKNEENSSNTKSDLKLISMKYENVKYTPKSVKRICTKSSISMISTYVDESKDREVICFGNNKFLYTCYQEKVVGERSFVTKFVPIQKWELQKNDIHTLHNGYLLSLENHQPLRKKEEECEGEEVEEEKYNRRKKKKRDKNKRGGKRESYSYEICLYNLEQNKMEFRHSLEKFKFQNIDSSKITSCCERTFPTEVTIMGSSKRKDGTIYQMGFILSFERDIWRKEKKIELRQKTIEDLKYVKKIRESSSISMEEMYCQKILHRVLSSRTRGNREECVNMLNKVLEKFDLRILDKKRKQQEHHFPRLFNEENERSGGRDDDALQQRKRRKKKQISSDSLNISMENMKKMFKIDANDVKLGEVIESGHFGTVFKGEMNIKREVAAKIIDLNNVPKKTVLTEFANQVCLIHPNIVRVFGIYKPPSNSAGNHIAIVMERMYKNLTDYVKERRNNRKTLTLGEKIKLMHGMASGLSFLHSLKILHRDIKGRNILVSKDGKEVKYCDFGEVRRLKTHSAFHQSFANRGTPEWKAPETFDMCPGDDSVEYRKSADVYSLGITFWELLFERVPYSDNSSTDFSRLKFDILDGKRPVLKIRGIKPLQPIFIKLLKDMWVHDRDKRLSTDEVLTRVEKLKDLSNKILKKKFP